MTDHLGVSGKIQKPLPLRISSYMISQKIILTIFKIPTLLTLLEAILPFEQHIKTLTSLLFI